MIFYIFSYHLSICYHFVLEAMNLKGGKYEGNVQFKYHAHKCIIVAYTIQKDCQELNNVTFVLSSAKVTF